MVPSHIAGFQKPKGAFYMQKIPSQPITTRYWSIFIAVFLAHNLEEIWRNLPGWSITSSPLRSFGVVPPYERLYSLFVLSAVGLTVGVALTGYLLERKRSPKSSQWLMVFCILMLTNALYHLMLSLWTRTLMPGVITATILVIPVNTWILYKLYRLSHSTKQIKEGRSV